ncbi:MAG: hypothetical protein AB7T86_07930 [Xanthobacteraceae bacterium]|uniref:hypothetical protein n=1 Tax=Pseudolabrys sp. TaxID=1960880 RepID=UPI003D1392F2
MTQPTRSRRRTLKEIFGVPLLLGVVSTAGLVIALVGDDLYDAAGWALLGVPVVVALWHMTRPDTGRSRTP